MSEMSVQMALSLVDAATPGLRTFATLIDGLGPKVTGLANRFTTLERNLSRVGSAADQAAPKVDKFSTSMTKLESTSQSVEAIMGNLPTVLSAFTAALQAALAVVTQASNGLNALSGSARTASGNIQGATNNLNQMGNAVNNVQKQVVSLNGVMEGFAARWASMKIFEGGKAIVDEAAQFQLVQKRIEALNLPNGQSAQINSDAEATAKRLGISVRDGLETYMAAIAGLAVTDYSESKKVIADTLDNAIKAAIVLRLRGDTSSVQDITRNLYGLIDARGQTHDAEAANRTIDLVQKNNAATGGKLTTKDLETISRQLKNGIGATVSDDGLLEIWAFASALKASGKGGGGGGMGVSQAGTAATQVAKWGLAGIHNKDSIRALQAMGLVDYGAAKGDSSTTMDNIGPGALKNSEMAVKAPIGFLMEMAPYALALAMKNKDMFAKGQDVTTPEGMKTALTEVALALFKNVNQANMAVQAWLPETATRIRSEVQQTKNAKGNQAAFDDVDKTYVRNTEKFTAAVHTLEVTLGNGLLPIITPIVEKLGEFLAFLNGVAAAHPTAATLTEVALGFLGVAGSIFALQKMFGIFTLMGTMVKGLGEAMGLMGAPTAAGATAAAGGLKILGIGLKGILGWVGLLWILYDVLLVVFDTKVWGVSIGNWFSGFVDGIIKGLDNLKDHALSVLGIISEEERKKRKDQNNKERVAGQVAAGIVAGQPTAEQTNAIIKPVAQQRQEAAAQEEVKAKVVEAVKNKEEVARQKLIDDAKKLKVGVYDPNKKDKGYNAGAGEWQQQLRIDESELRAALKTLDAAKKSDLISDNDYYLAKIGILNNAYDTMIADVKKKRALLRPNEVAARQRADADIEILQNQKEAAVEQATGVAERARADYKAQMSRVQSILDEAEGKRHESRLEKLKQELEIIRKKAVLNGTTGDVAQIDKAIRATNSGIAYENKFQEYTKINDKVIQQNDVIDAKVKAGMMTEAEAAQQKWQLRKDEAEQLDGLLKQLETLAAANGDEALVQKIALLKIQMQGYTQSLNPGAVAIKGVLQTGFSTFFTDIVQRNKSVKDSFKDLFGSVEKGILDLIAKNLSQQLFTSLFGGSAGGGSLNFLGGLLGGTGASAGGSLWTTAMSGSTQAAAPVFERSIGLAAASFDVGTNAVPFDMLANIHKDEIIVPAADRDAALALWKAGSGGSGMAVTNNFHLSGPTDNRTQTQIAALAAQATRNAQRNL